MAPIPQCSARLGEAVARLYNPDESRGATKSPGVAMFGTPMLRRWRASIIRTSHVGPRNLPESPCSARPCFAVGASNTTGVASMINDALRTILPIAGWRDERAREVEITGGTDPILPTPFRIGETSAAALAAVGLAVSDVWALRTGRRQEGAVDVRQATASLRSGHYMQMDGAHASTERNTVIGGYSAPTGRWRYLH